MKEMDTKDNKSALFHDFLEASGNFFIFLPYFFSVSTLLKTLFLPWKNLTVKKKSRAFSLNEYFNVFSFNLVSRTIGFIMRLSIVFFYLLVQAVYLMLLPFIFLIFLSVLCRKASLVEVKKSFQRAPTCSRLGYGLHTAS